MKSTNYDVNKQQLTRDASSKIVRKRIRWFLIAITAIAGGVAATVVLAITPLSGGLAGGTTITINNGPGDQTDPHVNGNLAVYTDSNGSGVTRLTRDRALDGSPDWSPDGTKIIFASNRTGLLDFEIWVMNASGTNPVRLTTGPRASIQPSWSTDGSKIVFATNRDNLLNFEIYSMNANGSNPQRLTSNSVQDAAPNW